MSDLSPGQEVTVSGMSGGPALLLYIRGNSARVRMTSTGKERTVSTDYVTLYTARTKRAVNSLTVERGPKGGAA